LTELVQVSSRKTDWLRAREGVRASSEYLGDFFSQFSQTRVLKPDARFVDPLNRMSGEGGLRHGFEEN
jgi:hypothetical protein